MANDESAAVLTLLHVHHYAFHGDGILVDDGGVDVGAVLPCKAGLGHFVLHIVAADDTEVVALSHCAGIGETEGEGLGEAQVVGGFVFRQLEAHLVAVVLSAPGGHHHVGNFVLVVSGNHQCRLRSDVQFGTQIGAAFYILDFGRHLYGGLFFGCGLLFGAAGGKYHCCCGQCE